MISKGKWKICLKTKYGSLLRRANIEEIILLNSIMDKNIPIFKEKCKKKKTFIIEGYKWGLNL